MPFLMRRKSKDRADSPGSAFTEAILVTPMGALSVVICAILSHFFLKESLTFFVSPSPPSMVWP